MLANQLLVTEFIISFEKEVRSFGLKYLITQALIYLTDKIGHEIDKCNYACGIFVDFKNAFIL